MREARSFAGEPIARRHHFRTATGLTFTAASIGAIAIQVDIEQLRLGLAMFSWPWMLAAIASLMVGYLARIVRWQLMLRAAGAEVSLRDCIAPFMGSIAINNVFPLRLGDVMRAIVFPAAIGVGRIPATGTLVMERLVDVLTLLASLSLGVMFLTGAQLPHWLATASSWLAAIAGLLLLTLFVASGQVAFVVKRIGERAAMAMPSGKVARVCAIVATFFSGLEGMTRVPVLLALALVSVVVWGGETGLFYFVMRGFGMEATLPVAGIVMATATLSTLVPSAPGYVGPFHLAAFTALSMLGGSAALAAGFAVVAHAALWIPTTLAGGIEIVRHPDLFKRLRSPA